MTTFPVAIRPPDSLRFEREKLIGRLPPRISSWPAAWRRVYRPNISPHRHPLFNQRKILQPGPSSRMTPWQFGSSVLPNWKFPVSRCKITHISEIARREAFRTGKLLLEVLGQSINDPLTPPGGRLLGQNFPADPPVQLDHRSIRGQSGTPLSLPYLRL
jgi:hypothetical protein